jgi:hypothetical protein
MSNTLKNELMSDLPIKIIGFMMSIAIMVSSWFLSQAWDRILSIEKSIHQIELTTSAISANKFTTTDWISAKSMMDAEKNSLDRRIMRLEESIPVIKDSLIEIKENMKK